MKFWLSTVLAARFTLAILAAALAVAADASAHHSTAFFDGPTIATVQGTITRVEWRSPHIYIMVETKEANGDTVEWRFESVPTPIMLRAGWTRDSVRPGDEVTVQGHPRGEDSYAWLRQITKEDGTILRPPRVGTPADAPPFEDSPGAPGR